MTHLKPRRLALYYLVIKYMYTRSILSSFPIFVEYGYIFKISGEEAEQLGEKLPPAPPLPL